MRIELRDRAILKEAFLNKLVRRSDLVNVGKFTSVGRANARLVALCRADLLRKRTEICGMELRAPLYTCTPKGIRLIAEESGFGVPEALAVYRSGTSDALFRHAARTLDIRQKLLTELCPHRDGTSLVRWEPELRCHHEFTTGMITITMKPDAFCILRTAKGDHHCFLETDMGNVSLPKYRAKFARYASYLSSGAFTDAYRSSTFFVLTVTTDERRLHSLIEASSVFANVGVTTWRRVTETSIAGAVFTSVNHQDMTLKSLLST